MVRKLKTRDVSRPLYINYLKRAEECLDAARNSFNSKKWNAATINAVHSCIAACDARLRGWLQFGREGRVLRSLLLYSFAVLLPIQN